jgi:hypothetical protein
LADESVGYASQNSAQFLELLLRRENKGGVQDLTSLDLLLGKRIHDVLEALPGTVGDCSILLEQNVLEGFEYEDENCRGHKST